MELHGETKTIGDNMKVNSSRCLFQTLDVLRRFNGYIVAFASACIYACMAILVSSLADEMKSLTLTFSRAFLSTSLSLVVMFYHGTDIRIKSTSELKFHLLNAFSATAAMVCHYYAYQHMPTADASAIIYGYVAFTGVYGRVFLKEPFGIFGVVMAILTFVGILMIARPPILFQIFESGTFESTSGGIFPAIVAFSGSQMAALNIVSMRFMGKQNYPVMKSLFYTMVGTMVIIAVPVTILGQWWIPSCTWGRTRMVTSAVCGFLGYAGLIYALSVENVVYVSLVSLNDLLVVFLISIIFMGFKPTLLSIAGMLLIMGSSVVILLRKLKTSPKVSEKQAPTPDLKSLRFAEYEPLTNARFVKVTSV